MRIFMGKKNLFSYQATYLLPIACGESSIGDWVSLSENNAQPVQ